MLALIQDAIRSIRNPHVFELAQSYRGELLAEIRRRLPEAGLPGDALVQQEYQRRLVDHGVNVRPDIIIHVPMRIGADRRLVNFAVLEMDRSAGPKAAQEDFDDLDLAMAFLQYPLAVFLNVASTQTQASHYQGPFRDCLHCFAVRFAANRLRIAHAYWHGGVLVEQVEECG